MRVHARLWLAAGLLVVAGLAVGAGSPGSAAPARPAGGSIAPVAGPVWSLPISLATLIGMLVLLRIRSRAAGAGKAAPAGWLRRLLSNLLVIGATAALIGLLWVAARGSAGLLGGALAGGRPRSAPSSGGGTAGGVAGAGWWLLPAVLLVGGLVAAGLVLRARAARARGGLGSAAGPGGSQRSRLAAAAGAGRARIGADAVSGQDPRQAIIDCYAAMEAELAGTSARPRAADTAAELLHRAIELGLLSGPATGRLLDLFEEARFSRHPIGAGQRDAAAAALEEILSELAAAQPAGATAGSAAVGSAAVGSATAGSAPARSAPAGSAAAAREPR